MQCNRLDARPDDWDELIDRYDTKQLFHESAWLDHMHSIHPDGELLYYELVEDGAHVGYHCGLEISKVGLSIHGSPLGGTGTNFLGPLVDYDVDQRAVVDALKGLVSVTGPVHMELSHFWLDRDVMEAAGFEVHESVTHLVELPESEDEAWSNLSSSGRNRVRKGRKNGLVVEHAEDPAIVEEFYERFEAVYAKQDLKTPFGTERPASLFEHLMPAGRLLCIRVKHEDTVVAAGMFPFDEKCIYFWGGASLPEHYEFVPNELVQWSVISFAVERGIPAYNMCGGQSRFKNKFGGEDVPYNHYSYSGLPGLKHARDLYRRYHFWRLDDS